MNDLPVFELKQTFHAPPERVWWGWTDSEPLSHWYGPNVKTVIHQLDVQPGGLWLCEMNMGENSMYQRAEYLEVVPMERLVWLHSSSDEDWNITNPPMPGWPRTLLSTLTLQQEADATRMLFVWTPHEATEAEIEGFSNALGHLEQGWTAGMKLLEELL